jgi:hypothetical protein
MGEGHSSWRICDSHVTFTRAEFFSQRVQPSYNSAYDNLNKKKETLHPTPSHLPKKSHSSFSPLTVLFKVFAMLASFSLVLSFDFSVSPYASLRSS